MFCYFCSKCLFFIHHDCIALHYIDPWSQDVNVLVEKAEAGEMDWRTCLETIVNMDSSNMDQETFGVYGINVEDKDVNLLIEVSQAGVIISDGLKENTTVSVKISSSDLAGILKVWPG